MPFVRYVPGWAKETAIFPVRGGIHLLVNLLRIKLVVEVLENQSTHQEECIHQPKQNLLTYLLLQLITLVQFKSAELMLYSLHQNFNILYTLYTK